MRVGRTGRVLTRRDGGCGGDARVADHVGHERTDVVGRRMSVCGKHQTPPGVVAKTSQSCGGSKARTAAVGQHGGGGVRGFKLQHASWLRQSVCMQCWGGTHVHEVAATIRIAASGDAVEGGVGVECGGAHVHGGGDEGGAEVSIVHAAVVLTHLAWHQCGEVALVTVQHGRGVGALVQTLVAPELGLFSRAEPTQGTLHHLVLCNQHHSNSEYLQHFISNWAQSTAVWQEADSSRQRSLLNVQLLHYY